MKPSFLLQGYMGFSDKSYYIALLYANLEITSDFISLLDF